MCKISTDTIQRANEAVMNDTHVFDKKPIKDDFSATIQYNGKTFTAHFSHAELNAAYAAAYKKVMCG